MRFPQSLKPASYGFVAGAIAVSILGFSWGGWVTGGSAEDMAEKRARSGVIAAMVPVCVDLAANDPDYVAKLATIKDASSYRRRDAIMEAGWTTMPGASGPDRDLATACLAGLDLDAS